MITTSPNRVKHGVYWCEEADSIVAKSLEGSEYTLDSEIPFDWIIEHNTLADTLLSLGATRPRHQPRANDILLDYCRRIYTHTRNQLLDDKLIPDTEIIVSHWINSPARAQASKLEMTKWTSLRRSHNDPYAVKLFSVMELLFSQQPLVLKATHGTKYYLGAMAMKFGFGEADVIRQNLKKFVRDRLEKYNDQ